MSPNEQPQHLGGICCHLSGLALAGGMEAAQPRPPAALSPPPLHPPPYASQVCPPGGAQYKEQQAGVSIAFEATVASNLLVSH